MSVIKIAGKWRRSDLGTDHWAQLLDITQVDDRVTGKLRLFERQQDGVEEILFESDVEGKAADDTAKIYLRTRPIHDATSLYIVEKIEAEDTLHLRPMGNDDDLAGAWVRESDLP